MTACNAAHDAETKAPPQGLSRRGLMLGAGAAAAALGLLPAWSRPAALAAGHVFYDRSGTGLRRAGDKGIAGVLVSNGRDVVRTDEDGRWKLAVRDGDSVFVVTPSGWAAPLGRGGVPSFSYLHRPQGTPAELALRYPGVAPTGTLPSIIDFPLTPADDGDSFEALLIADPQPQTGRELSYLSADLAANAVGSKAAFALVHGDIAFDDLTLYPRYLDIIGATGLTWHHCPGNHDMNAEAPTTALAFETWKRTFGPCHYAFQRGRATFIVLNNVSRTPGGEREYGAEVTSDQLAFVRNLLAHVPRDSLVVLSMHIPLMSRTDIADPVPHVQGREALLRLLSPYRHTVSFSGHTHTAEHHYLGTAQGWFGEGRHHHQVLATASGCWWGGPVDHRGVPIADCQDGSPRGFHVLEVDGNAYTTRFVAASRAVDAFAARILIDQPGALPGEPVARQRLGDTRLLVNVFDGGPRTSVLFELAGHAGSSRDMQREDRVDPAFAGLHARAQADFKPWVTPILSSHLWSAPLPTGLAPGAYPLNVDITDEYGRRRRAHALLEVTDEAAQVHAAAG
jgi:hypothetical protein